MKQLALGTIVPIFLSLIATLNISEHNNVSSISIIGYKNRFKEYSEKYTWAEKLGILESSQRKNSIWKGVKQELRCFFIFIPSWLFNFHELVSG